MTRGLTTRLVWLLFVLALGLGACTKGSPPPSAFSDAELFVSGWLALASNGGADAGWTDLSPGIQADEFQNDAAAYQDALDASDWGKFDWVIEESSWDDGIFTVFVSTESTDALDIPSIFRDHDLAGPWYEGTTLRGVVIFVGETSLEGQKILGGGARGWEP